MGKIEIGLTKEQLTTLIHIIGADSSRTGRENNILRAMDDKDYQYAVSASIESNTDRINLLSWLSSGLRDVKDNGHELVIRKVD